MLLVDNSGRPIGDGVRSVRIHSGQGPPLESGDGGAVGKAETLDQKSAASAFNGAQAEIEKILGSQEAGSSKEGSFGLSSTCMPRLLGMDVDFVNSVQLSNHTGYETIKGSVLDGAALLELVEGLKQNWLLNYDYLITGYIGSVSFLEAVTQVLDAVHEVNPRVKYVCDPVLGDDGQFYAPAELLQTYREAVVPRAFMLMPNQFEAELLSGISIQREEDVVAACAAMLRMGPTVVFIKSCRLLGDPETLYCYGAHWAEAAAATVCMYRVAVPRIDAYFTGSGDASSALLMAWTHWLNSHGTSRCPNHGGDRGDAGHGLGAGEEGSETARLDLALVMRNTMASIQGALRMTLQAAKDQAQDHHRHLIHNNATGAGTGAGTGDPARAKAEHTRSLELNVVRARRLIESPAYWNLDCIQWEQTAPEAE